MDSRYDIAVVGSGIVGLSHAYHAARAGLRVRVVERAGRPNGASVRNFGMVWPIGRPNGPGLERALRARGHWLDLAERAGFWLRPCGSLHLATEEDELAVLREFADGDGRERGVETLSPLGAAERCGAVNTDRVIGALWSPSECVVDPREAIASLVRYLDASLGVTFSFSAAAVWAEPGVVRLSTGERVTADRVLVCSGGDFETLLPELYREAPVTKTRLQMLRAISDAPRLSTHIAGGLSLLHYPAFANCPSLPSLAERVASTMPGFVDRGIHVMASENEAGAIAIGDTHHNDRTPSPFRDERADEMILGYLAEMLRLPNLRVIERWMGVYPKRTDGKTFLYARPAPGLEVVNAIGGLGMTISLAVAEEVIAAGRDGDAPSTDDTPPPTAARIAEIQRTLHGNAAPLITTNSVARTAPEHTP